MSLPQPSFAEERRISIILTQYWNRIRGDAEFPTEDQIDPDSLMGVWDRCFLVQMRDIEHVEHFNYTYFGEDLSRAYIDGRLDPNNAHIAAPDASLLAPRYREVIAERAPVMEDASYTDHRGRKVYYRQVFMPIGHDDGEIHAIFGGGWFRIEA